MTLKINYLDRQKDLSKNMALFLGKDAKISDFKGNFDDKINQKILKFLKQNQKITKNKISSLNLEFDQKLIIIMLATKSNPQETEELGAKFYDYIKKNEINEIYLIGTSFLTVKNKIQLNEFLHGSELKAYEFNLYKSKKNKKEKFSRSESKEKVRCNIKRSKFYKRFSFRARKYSTSRRIC